MLDMLPLPAAYIMDLQEAWKASGLRAFPSKFPDLDCMVPNTELNEARKIFEQRTVEKMQRVSQSAALMCASCDSNMLSYCHTLSSHPCPLAWILSQVYDSMFAGC